MEKVQSFFDTAVSDINARKKKYDSLKNLMLTLTNSGCFDEEDMKLVNTKLESEKKYLLQKVKEIEKKRSIYDNALKCVKEMVDTRQTVLENIEDNVFDNYPDILNFFTEKQDSLNNELETIETTILQ